MNIVDIFNYLKEENDAFDAEAFKADPYAFFEKNNWIIPTLNRDKIIIALADYFKNNKKLAGQNIAILIKLADHNKDFGEYLNNYSKLNEECERDKKRKKAIEFNKYSLIASRSAKLKKALAILCMLWAVRGTAPALPSNANLANIKAPTAITQTMNEEDSEEEKI